MKRRQRTLLVLVAVLGLLPSGSALAVDVLKQVPRDALGFVTINQLEATDDKIAQLLEKLGQPYPTPLIFLKAITGIDKGLNPQGDLLLAALPGSDISTPKFALWLPVSNYGELLNSLSATPGDGIAAITVAEEDLLIAQRGEWALIMDPDQRERMMQLLAEPPSAPPQIADWTDWLAEGDAAAVVLPAGARTTLKWAMPPPAQVPPAANREASDPDVFGEPDGENDRFEASRPSHRIERLQVVVQGWLDRSPEFRDWINRITVAACAIQIDDEGNTTTSWRAKFNPVEPQRGAASETALPHAMHEPVDFVIHGGGQSPPAVARLLAATYARQLLHDLQTEERVQVDPKTANQFVIAMQTAAADIGSWAVASPIEVDQQGVATNNFLAVRVASADTFVQHTADVIEQWNTMHREAREGTRLVFDIEQVPIGTHQATQYSIDVAAIEGMPEIPEVRQLMEKYFGPEGRLRLWVVPIDGETVLLAAATPDQVKKAAELLDRKHPLQFTGPSLAESNQLLPEKAGVRLFLSPKGYATWQRRQSEVMTGEVFGAPPWKEFPVSPPIGIAIDPSDDSIRLKAVVPAKTLEAAGAYLSK